MWRWRSRTRPPGNGGMARLLTMAARCPSPPPGRQTGILPLSGDLPHRRRHLSGHCSGDKQRRPDSSPRDPVHRLTRMPSPFRRRDEKGATLILALVFIFAIAMILVAVGGLAANALLNTSNARSQRTTIQDADNAVTIAMDYVRYNYVTPPPGQADANIVPAAAYRPAPRNHTGQRGLDDPIVRSTQEHSQPHGGVLPPGRLAHQPTHSCGRLLRLRDRNTAYSVHGGHRLCHRARPGRLQRPQSTGSRQLLRNHLRPVVAWP